MARAEFLMWAFYMILFLAHCQQQGGHGAAETVPGIGVNWGAIASHPMEPPIVVNMLKDNGIKKVKLFEADSWTVSAFSGTDIELMVGIPNDQLKKLSKSKGRAEDWVKHNVSKHMHDGGVNIRYVSVGNEAFLKSYNGSFIETTFPAMENIQRAIDKAGFGDKIKVTTALNADVYESGSNKPSDGEFRKDIYDVMKPIVQFLDEKKSPFVVNIYPFLSLYQNEDFPKDFAFFDSPSRTIDDKNHHYNNMFDANLDTLIWSLKKMGHPNVSIMIGEIGWPTDGDKNANPKNAKRFYQGFLKKMASKKGTPLHPGHINTYLFSLFDENKKSIAPGDFERHWGKGEDKMPIGAKGVRYQEHKWCVLSKDVKNMSELSEALSYACAGGDCTSLGPDCSCADLNEAGNASYAFNQYFQINDQSVEACDFNGVATIVSEDPSKGSCIFPVAIISSGTMLKWWSRWTLMGPLTLSVRVQDSAISLPDGCTKRKQNLLLRNSFASVSMGEEKPFDFLRTLFEGVIAGGTAGVVVETALYPIDTIKTRLQAARGGEKLILKGLYSGLAGNLAGVLPASALFVGVYEPIKQKLLRIFPENLSAFAHLTAGAIGGIAASLVRVPTEVVKQRMQTGQYTSASGAVRFIASKEGFKGFYAGYGSFLLRDLPFDAIQFCIYEQIRIGYKLAARRDLNDPENAIIGAFAGALTGAITTPLDVIKTRLMIQGSANRYNGIVDCVQTIIKEEGPRAFLKGVGPRVLWIGIGGSIFFGVLEGTKRFLAERRPTVAQYTNSEKSKD
ncbi:X8 domain [Sesbania bispinosa]|nr:X8 domain [Sesbania bispinosa]